MLVLFGHIGASRGFAFVEFAKIADAQKWMDSKKVDLFSNLHEVFMKLHEVIHEVS